MREASAGPENDGCVSNTVYGSTTGSCTADREKPGYGHCMVGRVDIVFACTQTMHKESNNPAKPTPANSKQTMLAGRHVFLWRNNPVCSVLVVFFRHV